MEKLTVEQAKDLAFYKKGKESVLSGWIKSLAVGEALKVSCEEWTGKRPPYYRVNYIARKLGWKFQCGENVDRTGWIIKRVG